MRASIDEIGETNMIVEPLPEDTAYEKAANRISVGTNGQVRLCGKYAQPLALGEFRKGDIVEIYYDGIIMETDPRQVWADEIRLFEGKQESVSYRNKNDRRIE